MSKSLYEINELNRANYKTIDNTFDDFCIGTKVKIICICQDHYFFSGETGTVVKNTSKYLGVTVEFDKPRHFKDGHIQKNFGFNPSDLHVLEIMPRTCPYCNQEVPIEDRK